MTPQLSNYIPPTGSLRTYNCYGTYLVSVRADHYTTRLYLMHVKRNLNTLLSYAITLLNNKSKIPSKNVIDIYVY